MCAQLFDRDRCDRVSAPVRWHGEYSAFNQLTIVEELHFLADVVGHELDHGDLAELDRACGSRFIELLNADVVVGADVEVGVVGRHLKIV